jgi:hypothetical protein
MIRVVPVATREALLRLPFDVLEAIKEREGAFYREAIGRLAQIAGNRWAYTLEPR